MTNTVTVPESDSASDSGAVTVTDTDSDTDSVHRIRENDAWLSEAQDSLVEDSFDGLRWLSIFA